MCGESVLIVLDDASLRETIAGALRQDGHLVSSVATGAVGLARARAGVDVILLDEHLPDVDGFAARRGLSCGT